ncbi:MAG: hypothetical protein JXR78_08605 [Victivallales bacterium]|nr:hypothetical protein [Victivallales bacterium]
MSYYEDYFVSKNVDFYEVDGIVNKEKWVLSKSKILFILKETAGYKKSKFYLKDEIPCWIDDNVPTYVKIAKLVLLIEKSLADNKVFSDNELKIISSTKEELKEYIEYCSVININKESVEHKSNDQLVYTKYLENKELLQQQIIEIQPRIVVVGSDVCWKCISYETNGLYSDYQLKGIKKHKAVKAKGIIFYHANHPSAWTQGGFNVRNIYRSIMEFNSL